MFVNVSFTAPVLSGSILKIVFTNFDISTCTLQTTLGAGSSCSLYLFTGNVENNTEFFVILSGITNNIETVDGTIQMSVVDSSGANAQISSTVNKPFIMATISNIGFTALVPQYGSVSDLLVNYMTKIMYKSGAQLTVSVPVGLKIPSTPICLIGSTSVPCTVSTSAGLQNVVLTMPSSIPKNSQLAVTIKNTQMPYCADNTLNVQVKVTNVETGQGTFGALVAGIMTGTVSQNSTTTGQSDTASLAITYPVALKQGSKFVIALPSVLSNIGSCTVTGLELGATCVTTSASTLEITNAASSADRPPGTFTINLGPFSNPRTKGSYLLAISAQTASPSSCQYLGSQGLAVQTLTAPALTSVAGSVSPSSISTYHSLQLNIVSPIALLPTDKVEITLPSNVGTMTPAPLLSLPYTSSPLFKYLLSPPYASTESFLVQIVDQDGAEVLSGQVNISYAGPGSGAANVSFESDYVGDKKGMTFIVTSASFLNAGCKVRIDFSDKFGKFGDSTVESSDPIALSSQTDTSKRQVTLTLAADVQPGQPITFKLMQFNPTVTEITSSDIGVSVLVPNSFTTFKVSPVVSAIIFRCAAGCQSCGSSYQSCQVCEGGFYLHPDGVCRGDVYIPPKLVQKAPPVFIFLALELLCMIGALTAWLCKSLEFPMNWLQWPTLLLLLLSHVYTLIMSASTTVPKLWTILIGSWLALRLMVSLIGSLNIGEKRGVENVCWIIGAGATRHGVAGYGKCLKKDAGITKGWRWGTLLQAQSDPELNDSRKKKLISSESDGSFGKWRSMVNRIGLFSIIGLDVPVVIFCAIAIGLGYSLYALIELAILGAISIPSYGGAWYELAKAEHAKSKYKISVNGIDVQTKIGEKGSKVKKDGDHNPMIQDLGNDPLFHSKSSLDDPLNSTKPFNRSRDDMLGGLNDTSTASLMRDFSIDLPNAFPDSGRSGREDLEEGAQHSRKKTDRNFIYIEGLDDTARNRSNNLLDEADLDGSKKGLGKSAGGKSLPHLTNSKVINVNGRRSPGHSDGDGDSDQQMESYINDAAKDTPRKILGHESEPNFKKPIEGATTERLEGQRTARKRNNLELDLDEYDENLYNGEPSSLPGQPNKPKYFDPVTGTYILKSKDGVGLRNKPTAKDIKLRQESLVPIVNEEIVAMREYNPYFSVLDPTDATGKRLLDPSHPQYCELIGKNADPLDPDLPLIATPMNAVPEAPSGLDPKEHQKKIDSFIKAAVSNKDSKRNHKKLRAKEDPIGILEAMYVAARGGQDLPKDREGRPIIPKPGDPGYLDPKSDYNSGVSFGSKKTRTDAGSLKLAQPSRHKLNRLRERWSSPQSYLEIIYEEGEDDNFAKIRENPIYDDPFKENMAKSKSNLNSSSNVAMSDKVKDEMRRELAGLLKSGTVSAKMIAERADEYGLGGIAAIVHCIDPADIVETTERLQIVSVNNQPIESFLRRQVRFKDGKHIPLNEQAPLLLMQGVYIDNTGKHLLLGKQDPKDMRKGIVTDPFGNKVLIADLNAADLEKGIWTDPQTGEKVLVNGQPASSLSGLLLLDKDNQKLNLRKQPKISMLGGKFTTDGGIKIDLKTPQDKETLERGLFKWKDGKIYAWKDQNFQDLANGKVSGLSRYPDGKFATNWADQLNIPENLLPPNWSEQVLTPSDRNLDPNISKAMAAHPASVDEILRAVLDNNLGDSLSNITLPEAAALASVDPQVMAKLMEAREKEREIFEQHKEFFGEDIFAKQMRNRRGIKGVDSHLPIAPNGIDSQFDDLQMHLDATQGAPPQNLSTLLRQKYPNMPSRFMPEEERASTPMQGNGLKMSTVPQKPVPPPDTLVVNLIGDDESFDLSLNIIETTEEFDARIDQMKDIQRRARFRPVGSRSPTNNSFDQGSRAELQITGLNYEDKKLVKASSPNFSTPDEILDIKEAVPNQKGFTNLGPRNQVQRSNAVTTQPSPFLGQTPFQISGNTSVRGHDHAFRPNWINNGQNALGKGPIQSYDDRDPSASGTMRARNERSPDRNGPDTQRIAFKPSPGNPNLYSAVGNPREETNQPWKTGRGASTMSTKTLNGGEVGRRERDNKRDKKPSHGSAEKVKFARHIAAVDYRKINQPTEQMVKPVGYGYDDLKKIYIDSNIRLQRCGERAEETEEQRKKPHRTLPG